MSTDNSSYIRELKRVEQQEKEFLKKRKTRKTTLLNTVAEDRIPKEMQTKLQEAFVKAFQVIFDRGMLTVERTINRRGIENRWEENIHHAQILRDSSSMRNLSREAAKDSLRSMLLTGASGVGLGVLGIGLPDIPVFAGMMIRDVCTRALNYGFHYDSDEEKYFILLVIRGAFLFGKDLEDLNTKANRFMKTSQIPDNTSLEAETALTAQAISSEILTSKFLQSLPIVGMVGGAYDVLYMARLAEYSDLKYRKRMLDDYAPSLNAGSYNPVHVVRDGKKEDYQEEEQ